MDFYCHRGMIEKIYSRVISEYLTEIQKTELTNIKLNDIIMKTNKEINVHA